MKSKKAAFQHNNSIIELAGNHF